MRLEQLISRQVMPIEHRIKIASLLLRLGVGGVFFWFGVDKFLHPQAWTAWVPSWMPGMIGLDPTMFIYVLGIIELVLGGFVLVGRFLRLAALGCAVALAGIVASLPWSDISVRDLGLLAAALALFFLAEKKHKA